MIKYVLGFIVCLELKAVLLIEKTKPAFQAGFYNGIGGKIEYKESSLQAMVREAFEECALISDTSEWKSICNMYKKKEWSVDCFTIDVSKDTYYSLHTKEKEKVVSFMLHNIHTGNDYLLGNIPWLVGMSIDRLKNNSYVSPVIEYIGLSLPVKF